MFNIDLKEIFPVLLSVPYSYDSDIRLDFSNAPRPHHNLLVMKEGFAQVESDGKTLCLKQGDILFIPKNSTYNSLWQINDKLSFHTIHFSFSAKSDPFAGKNLAVQLLDNSQFDKVHALFKQTEKIEQLQESELHFAISALFSVFGILFPHIKAMPQKPINKALLPALDYLQNNYFKPVTVEHLASLCFLSPSRFYYLFKSHTGVSPIVYKNQLAIAGAANDLLLNQDENILNIAKAHGFTNLIYFERLFKKVMGQSPSAYRKTKLYL